MLVVDTLPEPRYSVVYGSDGWRVIKEGLRLSSSTLTQQAAIEFAKAKAMVSGGTVRWYDRDGAVQGTVTY